MVGRRGDIDLRWRCSASLRAKSLYAAMNGEYPRKLPKHPLQPRPRRRSRFVEYFPALVGVIQLRSLAGREKTLALDHRHIFQAAITAGRYGLAAE